MKGKCRFHRGYGHDTYECYDLKQQIEVLIKLGMLKNFIGQERKDERPPLKGKVEELVRPPLGEIKVIIEGTSVESSFRAKKNYIRVVQNVQLTDRQLRAPRMDELAITFMDEEARGLHHPHNDAIVTTLTIANYTMRRVLADNESSVDILYYSAFQQMRINKELLYLVNVSLIGFGGIKVLLVETIFQLVMVGFYP